jgi:poly-gamma-glutamate synthesis protein (capsule biosynthesis protein)
MLRFLFFISIINSIVIAQSPEVKDSAVCARITVVGDLMCHSGQFKSALLKNGRFDFNPSFQFVKKYLINSDFTIGNLETVTAGNSSGFSGYPFFNTPDEYLSALKNSGFDLVTTSNNHALDQGKKGIIRTIKELNNIGIISTGTFLSRKDRDSIRIENIKGIRIAFLSYSYGTNGNPIPESYLINLIDTSLVKTDIKKARAYGAEIIFVYFHFGNEYQTTPSLFQKEIVKRAINAGADIIIGGHPHVLQPLMFFKSKGTELDSGLVAYSMGNFLSAQRKKYTDSGIILHINLIKNFRTDSIKISKVSFTPTWVFKGKINDRKGYYILPSQEAINGAFNFLTDYDLDKIKDSVAGMKNILLKYTPDIKIYNYQQDIINQIKKLAAPRPVDNIFKLSGNAGFKKNQ